MKNAADQVRRMLDGAADEADLERAFDAFGSSYHPDLDGLTVRAWLTELETTLRHPGESPNERLGA